MGFLKFVMRLRLRSCCKGIQENGVVCVNQRDGSRLGASNSKDGDFNFKEFTWEDMKRVTKNFSKVIGLGGFSTVYLARFPDSTRGAVKVVHGSSSSERLRRIYEQELQILLRVRHPDIVSLLGYCDDDREDGGVLVFEYVPNENLQEKLHGEKGPLTWKQRVLIAFQLANAMEYLHEKSGLHIVHGDIKASNILLDAKLNCKLCDFGSSKMGFASTVLPPSSSRMDRMILGSQGYMDPHYLKTGIVSKKNDIYSFGVIVLELVTGKEAFCLSKEKELTSGAGAAMEVKEMVDPRLENDSGFELEEAKAMAFISAMCLCNAPILRPSATQILASMRDKINSISLS